MKIEIFLLQVKGKKRKKILVIEEGKRKGEGEREKLTPIVVVKKK
jgi:hypothetical protein